MKFKEDEIVVIGAKGQLGSEIMKTYPKARAIEFEDLDITNEQAVSEFDWKNVKIIINAAAWTNVDAAEEAQNKSKVWAVNSHAVKNLAEIANGNSAIFVHVSSDYVFNGELKNHNENETFSPINTYGKSKAAGDLAAQTAQKHYILRTSWVIGTNSAANNFAKTMFNLASKKLSPKVVNDQFGRLTFTSELVRAVSHLLTNSPDFGVYNLSNSGKIKNWAKIAEEIFHILEQTDCKIRGISTEEYFAGKENIAKRPENSDLNLEKIHKTGFESLDYEPLLEEYIKELKENSARKGIILAGGSGTRLWPITKGVSKQLIPIYDKPMIYYPLSTLMQAGIRDILIITTPEDKESFVNLLGDGNSFGINIKYEVQPKPDGLAQAFIIGEEFIGRSDVALILGDNIFDGENLSNKLKQVSQDKKPTIFAYKVADPERYGVIEFNEENKAVSIEEKPKNPKSDYAAVGLYFYPNEVIEIAKKVKPSARGELEITDINKTFLDENKLKVSTLDRSDVWLDTGTISSMNDASDYVRVIQQRTGQIIGSPEKTAFDQKWITKKELEKLSEPLMKSGYGEYL